MFKNIACLREPEDPVPLPPRYVTLARANEANGYIKLKLRPVPRSKNGCVDRIVEWIKCANFTIDISLYFILHRKIINAIIEQGKKGVMVRILMYRQIIYLKEEKHRIYIEEMKKNGIQLKFVDFGWKELDERMILLDASDPENRPATSGNGECVIFGEQPEDLIDLPLSRHLERDIQYVRVRDHHADVSVWNRRFHNIWHDEKSSEVL